MRIHRRVISLDVVVPEKHARRLIAEFGRVFGVDDGKGGWRRRHVDSYLTVSGGRLIRVSVGEDDEGRFYNFLRVFCAECDLSFREPEKQPAS